MKKIDRFDLAWALVQSIMTTALTVAMIQNPLVKAPTDPTYLKVVECIIMSCMIVTSLINVVNAALLSFHASQQREEAEDK